MVLCIARWMVIGVLSLLLYLCTNVIRHSRITLVENCENSISMTSQLIRLTTESSPKYISHSLYTLIPFSLGILQKREILFQVYADSIITFPMYRTARLFARYCRHPVYFYKFTFQGRRSFYMLNDTTPYGKMIHSFFIFKGYGAVLHFHERNWKTQLK